MGMGLFTAGTFRSLVRRGGWVRFVPSGHERPGGALPSWTRRRAVVRELPIGLGWMLHIFLNWSVAVAWRFADLVPDGLATVWCWLAWVVSTNGAFLW